MAFPVKTWKVDKENNRIVGTIDGAEAYWQWCHKALSTWKENWVYYNQLYGIRNPQRYAGKDRGYIEAHFPKDVWDCVGIHFATTKVDNFEYEEIMTEHGKALNCKCIIWSIYGGRPFNIEMEVTE